MDINKITNGMLAARSLSERNRIGFQFEARGGKLCQECKFPIKQDAGSGQWIHVIESNHIPKVAK